MKPIFAVALWLCASLCWAIDPLPFADLQQEKRFQALAAELRCLQCQNQNLADSDAQLAKDMRLQVFSMMQGGQSDAQIKQYMVDRYGDFAVYSPPWTLRNALLWLTPLLGALGGLVFIARHFRGRQKVTPTPSNASQEDW
jgi:cytochrome c-type biogenesis protein CcmH